MQEFTLKEPLPRIQKKIRAIAPNRLYKDQSDRIVLKIGNAPHASVNIDQQDSKQITITSQITVHPIDSDHIIFHDWFTYSLFHYFTLLELGTLAKVCKSWRKMSKQLIGNTFKGIQYVVKET